MNQPALKQQELTNSDQPSELGEEKKVEVVSLSGLKTPEKVIDALKNAEGEKPGRFMKQLRELDGMSVSQMATDIGLSANQIVALESDDYENLPAPIYVKGFIKRYCAALGVSHDVILDVYDRAGKAEELSPVLNRVSIKKKMHSDAEIMRWVGYALAIAFAALVIIWLQSLDFENLFGGNTQGITQSSDLSLPVLEQPGADMAEQEAAK